jgi:hypothetical protein
MILIHKSGRKKYFKNVSKAQAARFLLKHILSFPHALGGNLLLDPRSFDRLRMVSEVEPLKHSGITA